MFEIVLIALNLIRTKTKTLCRVTHSSLYVLCRIVPLGPDKHILHYEQEFKVTVVLPSLCMRFKTQVHATLFTLHKYNFVHMFKNKATKCWERF